MMKLIKLPLIFLIIMTNSMCSTKNINGVYNIDTSKDNLHTYKEFKIEVEKTNNRINLYFLSSDNNYQSNSRKKRELYAFTNKVGGLNEELKLNLYEIRGNNKILTEHNLTINKNGLIISSENYRDHFKKYKEEDSIIKYEHICFRNLSKEELKEIDFEHQSGLELIFWLSEINKDNINNKDVFLGIKKSLDKIDKGIEFPIGEYNNYRQISVSLGYLFGQILYEDYGWKWRYQETYKNEYIGYTIISPKNKIGIKVEEYFYNQIMYNKDIQFEYLIENLNNLKTTNSFEFY